MLVIPSGRTILFKEEQKENALSPMLVMLLGNTRLLKDSQSLNTSSPMLVTPSGMTISVKKRTSGCFFPLRNHAWSSAICNFERFYIPPLYNQNDSAFQNRKENVHFCVNILFRGPFVRFLMKNWRFRIQTLHGRELSNIVLRNFHGGL